MKGIFTFLDKNKNLIEKRSILKLDYKRDVVVKKSIEMFDDEDPCIIHYTYSVNKIGLELLEKINDNCKKEELTFTIETWPGYIGNIFNVPKDTYVIKVQ